MMLVGLGVGIDYALLIFSRYRSELLKGADGRSAGRIALDTAGRSVLFAGCTVVIALLGLLALGLGSLQGRCARCDADRADDDAGGGESAAGAADPVR